MNRRDVLKFFGAGTIIAPVAAAGPLVKLIEVPKIEIVKAAKIPEPLDLGKVKSCKVYFEMDDGSQRNIVVGREWISSTNHQPFTGILSPTERLKVEFWFDRRGGSSPASNFRAGFLSGDVTLL